MAVTILAILSVAAVIILASLRLFVEGFIDDMIDKFLHYRGRGASRRRLRTDLEVQRPAANLPYGYSPSQQTGDWENNSTRRSLS